MYQLIILYHKDYSLSEFGDVQLSFIHSHRESAMQNVSALWPIDSSLYILFIVLEISINIYYLILYLFISYCLGCVYL